MEQNCLTQKPIYNDGYHGLQEWMPSGVYQKLKKSILETGLRRKIILNSSGEIVDGYWRSSACIELGIQREFEVRKFESKEHEMAFIVGHHQQKYRKFNFTIKAENKEASRMLSEIGYGLSFRGQLDNAIEIAKCALKLDFTNALAFMAIGRVAYQEGMLERAIENFDLAMRLFPADSLLKAYALERLGVCHAETGRLKKAFYFYEWALTIDPENARLLHNYGIDLFDIPMSSKIEWKKRLDEKAISMVEKAIELEPTEPLFHSNLGDMYSDLKMRGKAKAEYRKARELEKQGCS